MFLYDDVRTTSSSFEIYFFPRTHNTPFVREIFELKRLDDLFFLPTAIFLSRNLRLPFVGTFGELLHFARTQYGEIRAREFFEERGAKSKHALLCTNAQQTISQTTLKREHTRPSCR